MTGHRTSARWSVNAGRIERARVLNAWTRKHLAGVAHVTPKTLMDMCSGRRRPTFGTVQAVCGALGLTVADVSVFEDDSESSALSDVNRLQLKGPEEVGALATPLMPKPHVVRACWTTGSAFQMVCSVSFRAPCPILVLWMPILCRLASGYGLPDRRESARPQCQDPCLS